MQELDAVPFGVTSLDTCLAQAITYLISTGRLDWPRAIDCFSTQPARMLGIDAGTLAIGSPADVVAIDPRVSWTVAPNQLYSRNRNTPLLNQTLQGRAREVWIGGVLKYQLAVA
jgi:dihydroorotase